ncbi:MAG: rhomboid family intramembrane serine protease, partial [Candidatus Hydrothermarchaeaceae archaeon]
RRAVITYSLIAVNVLVFAYEVILSTQGGIEDFIGAYALVPRDITAGLHLHTLLTAMFLHGGFMHILGNMLYLHIFGDNIEDIMGPKRFIIFYVMAGLAASLLQIYVDPTSNIPNLGASGAIAGVLGAYLIMFPRAKVHTIVFFGYFIRWVRLPAVIVLGFWFIIQLFSGIGNLTQSAVDSGGVAFFAHVGGFIAGMVLVFFFKKR